MVPIRSFLLLLIQIYLFLTSSVFALLVSDRNHGYSLLADKSVLLAFKKAIVSDPNSTLANWVDTMEVCNFTGVTCGRYQHRVRQLNLLGKGLVGRISTVISNLTRLRVLNLADNRFFGTIPPELFSLPHLRHLRLDTNNLQGSIPDSFSRVSNLTMVILAENRLTGSIPHSIATNCTLKNLDLSCNFLSGKIPEEIGQCHKLWNLNLYNNLFTGELPVSLSNLSLLYNIDVEKNNLSGELPANIVRKLPELLNLHLSYNNMGSHDQNTNLEPFFVALQNCTKLEELELGGMDLGGKFPDTIGGLSVNLKTLLLQENQIFGSIPPTILNLSRLMVLNLSFNLLNGTICDEISQLAMLEQLFLSSNLFTGAIPISLGKFPHLGLLDLSSNQFSGEIPASLGNLVQVKSIFLNNNLLSGPIPATLGRCKNLYMLDLSYNNLTGNIPPQICRIRELRLFLNFSHNNLDGLLPTELHYLQNVQEIDFSSNNLTGRIFPQISSCIALKLINFSHNSLHGHLVDSLGDLKNLESFDVSGNHLSGLIPTSLNRIHSLTFLNLSFNNFEGKIPSGGIFNSATNLSFLGNKQLCGTVPGAPACLKRRRWFRCRKFLTIFISVMLASTIFCMIGIWRIKEMVSKKNERAQKPTMPEFVNKFPRITYRKLSEATGGFDVRRLIGTGSYGHVYKGVLCDGSPIAVKVMTLQPGNRSTKSFIRECQVLKRTRHRNLIQVITACSLPDFKALILPYMANGSLESHLHPLCETGLDSGDLTLLQRVNICSDIAEGMAYLHHHSPVKIIHCDLKPSNVLLNDDMTALVSDFGLARLVMTACNENSGPFQNIGKSTASFLRGSVGYIAPEYGFGSKLSTKGDVYSFGVLVLEMVTCKRPTDDMFVGGLNLHKWVKSHCYGKMEKVIDSLLVRASRDQSLKVKRMMEVAVGELIELGIVCTQESPSMRPTMLDVSNDLEKLKKYVSSMFGSRERRARRE